MQVTRNKLIPNVDCFEEFRQKEVTITLSAKEAYDLYLNLHEGNHPKTLTPLMGMLSKTVCSNAWQGSYT